MQYSVLRDAQQVQPNVAVEPRATARRRALYSWRCGSNRLLDGISTHSTFYVADEGQRTNLPGASTISRGSENPGQSKRRASRS